MQVQKKRRHLAGVLRNDLISLKWPELRLVSQEKTT